MKLHEVIAPLRFSTEKLKSLDIRRVDAVPILGVLNSEMVLGDENTKLVDSWMNILFSPGKLAPSKWPAPVCHMTELPTNPGVWKIKDPSGLVFYIFSDAHHGDAVRGTNVNVHIPPKLRIEKDTPDIPKGVIQKLITAAIKRLFDFLVDASR